MPWFKVDDQFWSHPKLSSVSHEAVSLWVRGGSYCAQHLTDGFVAEATVTRQLWTPLSSADELVEAGLWLRVEGGYQFHDWEKYQPTADDALAKREANRERKQKQRRNERGQYVTEASQRDKGVTPTNVTEASQRDKGVTPTNVTEASRRDTPVSHTNVTAESRASHTVPVPVPVPVPDPVPETLVVTTSCLSSPSTREHDDDRPVDNSSTEELDGINVWSVQRTVEDHVGVSVDVFTANRIACDIVTRATEPVKRPTAYVQAAIRNEPEAIRRLIEEIRGEA